MNLKTTILSIALLAGSNLKAQDYTDSIPGKFDTLIPVLNVGTFHMSFTNDGHSLEFDENNKENVSQVHELAKKLAAFKPTVIVVEIPPKYNEALLKSYEAYVRNPDLKFEHPSEIELLAYEVGRLSGAQQIYGIDFKERYNYRVGASFPKSKDIAVYNQYMKQMEAYAGSSIEEKLSIGELFQLMNTQKYRDFTININADILTHAASDGKAQGADQAAKYYHRNLVMYSNLNQLPLTKDDRVFILMGASHTAFFHDFLGRSPKYGPVDATSYLK
ncbi:hypothetical protein D3C87_86240 [compost metagenome]